MRHHITMKTTVKLRHGDQVLTVVFETEDFVNLEQELKRRTQLASATGKIVDQNISIRKMRTSY